MCFAQRPVELSLLYFTMSLNVNCSYTRRRLFKCIMKLCFLHLAISKAFFQKHKGALETRLPNLRPILIKLVQKNVLNSTEREEVQSRSTSVEKNECLLMILDRKGPEAQEIFCQVLQRVDPFLVKDLDENC